MNRKLFCISALALTLSACSGTDSKSATGGFKYADREEVKPLVIPQGLKQPNTKDDFKVASNINHDGPIGKNVDVRAPSLPLPVASSTRAETGTQKAIIWFDQVLDDVDLTDFIVGALQKQLAGDNVALNTVSNAAHTFESDWYKNEQLTGPWLFEEVKELERMRFRYTIAPKPHGRSASLTVDIVDYQSDERAKMDPIDKHRAEVAMLNEVVSQVDFQYRLTKRDERQRKASQQIVRVGENRDGEPAYLIDLDLDSVWLNLPMFFEDYGFEVTDLDESNKIYYVDFVKPENSFWTRIWGDDVPVIDVEDAKYQFVLFETSDNKTALSIYDTNGQVLPIQTIERIYPVMAPGLSFRDSL